MLSECLFIFFRAHVRGGIGRRSISSPPSGTASLLDIQPYLFPDVILTPHPFLSTNFGTGVLRNFTKVQILHPVAGALALIALIWGLVRHTLPSLSTPYANPLTGQLAIILASRACTIFMSLTAFLGLLAALVALAIDLALWIIARNRLHDRGYDADLVSCPALLIFQGSFELTGVWGPGKRSVDHRRRVCGTHSRYMHRRLRFLRTFRHRSNGRREVLDAVVNSRCLSGRMNLSGK